jgi:hypothetical protein
MKLEDKSGSCGYRVRHLEFFLAGTILGYYMILYE